MRRLVGSALLVMLAACGGDSTGPNADVTGNYTLRTVNGANVRRDPHAGVQAIGVPRAVAARGRLAGRHEERSRRRCVHGWRRKNEHRVLAGAEGLCPEIEQNCCAAGCREPYL